MLAYPVILIISKHIYMYIYMKNLIQCHILFFIKIVFIHISYILYAFRYKKYIYFNVPNIYLCII